MLLKRERLLSLWIDSSQIYTLRMPRARGLGSKTHRTKAGVGNGHDQSDTAARMRLRRGVVLRLMSSSILRIHHSKRA